MAEYARHRKASGLPGASDVAVLKALRTGRITPIEGGKIDFEVADIQWAKNTRKRADLHSDEPAVDIPKPEHKPQNTPNWGDHKARKEAAEASLRELQLEEKSGNLIDKTLAELAAMKMARTLRDALLDVMPSKISVELAAITDPWAIECRVRDAIRAELHAIIGAILHAETTE